ncbi:MAG: histidine kinase, partial [Flavobacteriales bacterium]|nr:histidine kinase [Flavobacteriales bacterium]
MPWNSRRRQANPGPILRIRAVAGLCLLLPFMAGAQADPQGWRGQLLAKADKAWGSSGSTEADEQNVIGAIRSVDALVSANKDLSDQVKELADSIVMELHAFDGNLKRNNGQPARAVVAFRAAIERARPYTSLAPRKRQIIDALARSQVELGDPTSAMRTYEEAARSDSARKDIQGWRETLQQQGILCDELRDLEAAIAVQERILTIDEASGDVQNLIGTQLRLGRLCEKDGREDAFVHATNAYKLAEQADNTPRLFDACDLLIRSFQGTAAYDQCKLILDKAMEKAQEVGERNTIARFHDRYGRFQFRANKPDEALQHYLAGLKVLNYTVSADAPDTGSTTPSRYLPELLLDLGQLYRSKGDTANAELHLRECERLLETNSSVRVAPWTDLGYLFLERGDVNRAASYGTRALASAENDPGSDQERRATELMYKVYKRQGNAEKALAMHERFFEVSRVKDVEYKLDLQRTQMTMTFSAKQLTDSVHQARRTEAYRAEVEGQKTRTRYLVIIGIALFLGAGVVAFIDRKRRMARFDKEAAQLETQALRSQMNPHFIFNALNSINAYVQKNEPDKAASFLSRFARLMRLVLENSRQSEVPLKDDLDALDAYLHLERARSGEKFDYRIEVAGDLDPEDVMVPPLVAQPFVENAIWHGMSGKTEKGMIKLSVSRKGDQLLFAIEDDGVGRSSPKRMASMGEQDPHDAPTKKTSLGTAITKARLDLVRQQKGKAAGFRYVDLEQGTRVELTLPFST